MNAAPRLPSSELALNWLLLPLHLLWPSKIANFTRGPGFSLLPSTRGKRPAGRGQWSLGKVVGAKAPDGGPSGRNPAQAWAPSASPASVTLQAGRAAPTRPLCDPEQPVPPPGAGLCLREPTHPPSPGAPPPALRSANKRRVPLPGPASPIPPPAAGAPQSGSPLAPGRGAGANGVEGRPGARAVTGRRHGPGRLTSALALDTHTAQASGDLRGSCRQSAGVPSGSCWVRLQPTRHDSRALLHRGNPQMPRCPP